MRDANDTMPKARADGTIIDEPALDEIVVYDLSRHRAHALNQTAAVVWRHCDGRTSFGAVATALGKSLGIRPNLELVGVTVERLRRACLLEQTVAPRAVETMRVAASGATHIGSRSLAGHRHAFSATGGARPIVYSPYGVPRTAATV